MAITITSDIDWAHDDIIKYMLSILNEYNIKITFFCTHKPNIDLKGHELAIHPNFMHDENYEETISKLMKLFPNAKGTRSHRLLLEGRLYPIYKKYGIIYDSNYFMYKQKNIQPFMTVNNIVMLPIYFADDAHIMFSNQLGLASDEMFNLDYLDLDTPGMKIFAFHPIHLFLNTNNLNKYSEAKKYNQNLDKLKRFINEKRGVRTLFEDLLEYIETNHIKTNTLLEITNRWVESWEKSK